jgi:drug/metabolite transporter (DMT)-like permease
MMLALLAYLLLAIQDATVKWLVATVPVWQIIFIRSSIVIAGCLMGGGGHLVRRSATSPAAPLMIRRGVITLAAWSCYFTAARSLPLGQLLTLYFTAPVVVVLLAALLLRERVDGVRWFAVGAGFAGAVLAADPVGLSLTLPTVLVLTAAILWGYGIILTRQIARTEPSSVQMFFNNCFFLTFAGIGTAVTWQNLSTTEILLLMQVATLGGLGQFCLFEAVRHAPASLTAPLEYTALIWAFVLGFAIWGDSLQVGVFLGAGLILLAGVALGIAEWRRTSQPLAETPSG